MQRHETMDIIASADQKTAGTERFQADVESIQRAGHGIRLIPRGAIIDGHIVLSLAEKSWKIVLTPEWHPYRDVSEVIRVLQTNRIPQ